MQRKPRFKLSLTWVFALSFTALTVISLGTVLVVLHTGARANTLALLADRVNFTLSSVETQISGHFDAVEEQLTYVTDAIASGHINIEDTIVFREFIFGALAATPQVTGIACIRDGLKVDLFRRQDYSYRRDDWSNVATAHELLAWSRDADYMDWGQPLFSPVLHQPVLTLRVPIRTRQGLQGVLAAGVTMSDVSIYLAKLSAEIGQTVFILHGRQHVLAHPNLVGPQAGLSEDKPLPRIDEIGDPVLAHMWSAIMDENMNLNLADLGVRLNGQGHIIAVDGQTYSVLYREVFGYGPNVWIIGTIFRGQLAQTEMRRLIGSSAISFFILLVAAGASLGIGHLVGRPVLRLARAADQIQHRDLTDVEPLPPSTVREFHTAATAFNEMVRGLSDRQRLRDLFGRYVSPQVAEHVLTVSGSALMAGDRREISLLFSDIADFTTVSEAHAPERVVPLLNAYMEKVCRIVAAHDGIVVDFVGDAVFAVFGAPVPQADHADRALAAAQEVDGFGQHFALSAQGSGVPFGITRLGVHTGIAMVGNFGAQERLKYGAAGDAVNTAARMEGANRLFGTRCMVSRRTVELVNGGCFRPLARLLLRGRSEPIDVFEPLPEAAAKTSWLDRYREAYADLDTAPDRARITFAALVAERPHDRVVGFHNGRLRDGIASSLVRSTEK